LTNQIDWSLNTVAWCPKKKVCLFAVIQAAANHIDARVLAMILARTISLYCIGL
jgi:hypothetical protein